MTWLILAGFLATTAAGVGGEEENGGALAAPADALRLPLPADRTSATRRLSVTPPKPASGQPAVFRARPGPWGALDYFTTYLEASVSTLQSMEMPTSVTSWKFVGYGADQVAALFTSVKMPAAIRAELLDRKKWQREGKIIVVLPSREALLALSPDARGAIYQVLGRWKENPFHHTPVAIEGQEVRIWLRQTDLPVEILATIEKTVYRREKNLVFADTPLLLRMAATEDERLRIRQALSRTPTLVVKLRLAPGADITEIADYWGGPTRAKEIVPLLESVAGIPGANVLDIIHLLPAGVRRLLYTFPRPGLEGGADAPDCHCSSLNFANLEPLDRLADPTMATAYTLENFTRISPGESYRLGDVLFFTDGNSGNAIHSCVYLADDIVYTKNGRSLAQPWVLMKLEDVITFYTRYYQPQIAGYRRKAP